MAIRLEGKVALVTGGGSGIGRASAMAFAREGAKVVVSDIVAEGGEETVQIIEKDGGEAIFVKADVSKAAEVEVLINEVIKTYGRLDLAHNNAGVVHIGVSTINCTEETWDNTINVNLKGVWLCMKYEIPQMLKHGGGAIVNTSSTLGLVGGPQGGPPYVASKHGVVGLTKGVALEYAAAGIRVNAVCPGVIRTPLLERRIASDPRVEAERIALHPIGRLGTAEDIAESVVWLCSGAASFITGHALVVDGGSIAQ